MLFVVEAADKSLGWVANPADVWLQMIWRVLGQLVPFQVFGTHFLSTLFTRHIAMNCCNMFIIYSLVLENDVALLTLYFL